MTYSIKSNNLVLVVFFFSLFSSTAYSAIDPLDRLGLEKSAICSALLTKADAIEVPEINFSGESRRLGDAAHGIAEIAIQLANSIVPNDFIKPKSIDVQISDGSDSSEANHNKRSIGWVIHKEGNVRQSSFVVFLHEYAHVLLDYALNNTKGGNSSWHYALHGGYRDARDFVFTACHELFTDVLAVALTNDGHSIYEAMKSFNTLEALKINRDFTRKPSTADASTVDSKDSHSTFTSVRRFLWSKYLYKGDLEVNKRVVRAVLRAIRREFQYLPRALSGVFEKDILLLQKRILNMIEEEMSTQGDEAISPPHAAPEIIQEIEELRYQKDFSLKDPTRHARERLGTAIAADPVLVRLAPIELGQLLNRLIQEQTSAQEIVDQAIAASEIGSQKSYDLNSEKPFVWTESKRREEVPIFLPHTKEELQSLFESQTKFREEIVLAPSVRAKLWRSLDHDIWEVIEQDPMLSRLSRKQKEQIIDDLLRERASVRNAIDQILKGND